MTVNMTKYFTLILFGFSWVTASHAGIEPETTVEQLQQRWAVANYQLAGKEKIEAFETLKTDAETYTAQHPEQANGWIWSGIIKSTYAGAKGGLGALGLAKAARGDLESALQIDGSAMNGSAYTSLGTLYFNVPGWPLGFGNNKKAKEFLLKGLEINPDGIDGNYFYAEFLRDQGELKEAKSYYAKAQSAPPRATRPLADEGRQKEIRSALAIVNKKLSK